MPSPRCIAPTAKSRRRHSRGRPASRAGGGHPERRRCVRGRPARWRCSCSLRGTRANPCGVGGTGRPGPDERAHPGGPLLHRDPDRRMARRGLARVPRSSCSAPAPRASTARSPRRSRRCGRYGRPPPTALVVLPAVSHALELILHYLRGTPELQPQHRAVDRVHAPVYGVQPLRDATRGARRRRRAGAARRRLAADAAAGRGVRRRGFPRY